MRPSVFPKIKVIKGLIIIGLHGIHGCAIQNIRMALFVYVVFLFGDHAKWGIFVCSAFTGWKHALDKFAAHANNQELHIQPYEQYITFRNTFCSHNRQPVNIQLDKINQNQIPKNRQILSSIVKAVLFCARQNIALRGHRDDACHLQCRENNSGNFQNLLDLMENCGDDVLKEYFKNAPRNATYRSKTTQNNISTKVPNLLLIML